MYEQDISLEDIVFTNSSQNCALQDDEQQTGSPPNKVVWVIIDGLRLDFLQPQPQPTSSAHNRFVHVAELLHNSSSNALLYSFVADPPTVTAQRLKALTTGTLPTFLDVGSNMHSAAVAEDNVLDQLVARYGTQQGGVVLGDDTWRSLYPTQFSKYLVHPSLDTRDLFSADQKVFKDIGEELRGVAWQLLVVHLLGVDHIGHTYHAHHPVMAAYLTRLDAFLHDIMVAMPNDAVLIVCSDHGMTDEGEHGGASALETMAPLLLYSTS
ncbi:hypothetical protein EON64_19890, partial [archaeon]